MIIGIPKLSLVLLIGASGAGKSTFARRHFRSSEILSSDYFRGLVSDEETDQTATVDAFETLHFVAEKRLARGLLTVIDATNVRPESRWSLVALARRFHVLAVAIVLNLDEETCHQRNQSRPDRKFGRHVVRNHCADLRRSLKHLRREGFRYVYELPSEAEIESVTIVRTRLRNDRTDERGPFDVIGDVHGCGDELERLLRTLGYVATESSAPSSEFAAGPLYTHPEGRKAVFVGDLVDRGPRVLDVLRIVANMTRHGSGFCVQGNHDHKLLRLLAGSDVKIKHGLAETLAELDGLPPEIQPRFRRELAEFLDDLASHHVFDDGRLVVAHAGLKESMHGRDSQQLTSFALYGDTTGEVDEFGLPVRLNWAADYRGKAMVVYGHTPVPSAEWLNGTVNIDTGCVFGGQLTALRYPEKEFVSVPAARQYFVPAKPFLPAAAGDPRTSQQQLDDILDLQDVSGKQILSTRWIPAVVIREENAAAALEAMSRYAANPKWLIYLPPTMSPSETSTLPETLEHPAEAFAYYRREGVGRVICQEKHMGSRAVVVVCRDEAAARRDFGIAEPEFGIVYTRTGRRFFTDPAMENAFLDRVRGAVSAAGLWDELRTDWLCLDCELMPWSAKAQELLRSQYAAVGAAGRAALPALQRAVDAAAGRLSGAALESLMAYQTQVADQTRRIGQFVAAYRHYCWPVHTVDDLKLAPFHLLASAGRVHCDRDHRWHLETLARLCAQDERLFRTTPHREVALDDDASVAAAIDWWEQLTARGGEGMVVKPLEFIARGEQGLVQPAIKCRGREYLRIIYGPDYSAPANLSRLRRRGLAAKRSFALREFALGLEALERFVNRQPLRSVHQCVFGVLALESEPVDPRL